MQRSKKQFLRPTWKVVFYAKSLLLHIFKSEALCQTKKSRDYFHSWSIHEMSTLKYKKVRKLCSFTINTNHYRNCRLSNLQYFAQIHTLHFTNINIDTQLFSHIESSIYKPIFYLVAFADRKRYDESIYVPATLNNTPVYCKRIQYIECNSNSNLVI